MSLRKVNVFSCVPDREMDHRGFWNREVVLAPALASARIDATLYEAVAGRSIWPYHYHYGIEEWLYVVSGRPVLRDAGGRRSLATGDLVCFPSGHLGAHSLEGPGRFIIFSTALAPPVLAVYPDSDKLAAVPTGQGEGETDYLMVRRQAAIDYWSGEGDGDSPGAAEVVRPPESAPGPAVVNTLRDPVEATAGSARLLTAGSARLLCATVTSLDTGRESAPYHYEHGREQWLLVLAGAPSVRHPAGEELLVAGDVTCFPEGPAGARQVVNRGEEAARVLFLSTTGLPANVCYPDSGTWVMRNTSGEDGIVVRPSPAG